MKCPGCMLDMSGTFFDHYFDIFGIYFAHVYNTFVICPEHVRGIFPTYFSTFQKSPERLQNQSGSNNPYPIKISS